jgi:hypothetical protein
MMTEAAAPGMLVSVDRRGPIPPTKGTNVFRHLSAPMVRAESKLANAGSVAEDPGVAPARVDAMPAATSVWTRRRLGRIAAVGAVALVLAGAVAAPAEARRSDAVTAANLAVGMCFSNGGDPNAYETGGAIYVTCTWEDGSVTTLYFEY